MDFISHTENNEGFTHGLVSHLKGVAKIMECFTDNPILKKIFWTTGI
jgi:hypothetical protein